MTDVNKETFSFSMLENGLDFIASGLATISKATDKRDLKYGVLHLASGVELVLKERLRQEEWSLIFPKPETADLTRYKTGDFYSINQSLCIERLEEYGIVGFDDQQKSYLELFRKKRNRLEHFELTDSKVAVESSAVKVLEVLLPFIGTHFDQDELTDEERTLLADIRARLGEFVAFTNSQRQQVKDRLSQLSEFLRTVVTCPACQEDALHPDVQVECFFCGFRASAEVAASMAIGDQFIDDDDGDMYDPGRYDPAWCPNCENEAVVDAGSTGDIQPERWVCYACGFTWADGDLETCDECQELCEHDKMFANRCPGCWDAFIAKDNT
jgi:hypothetical protein